MSGVEGYARNRLDGLGQTRRLARLQPIDGGVEEPPVLPLVVEGSDHHVATLMSVRVILVVSKYEPPDVVIIRVHPWHHPRIGMRTHRRTEICQATRRSALIAA